MQEEVFQKIVDDIIKECKRIHKTKGKEYTHGKADVLDNFKRIANEIGLAPLQVWSIYWMKHIDSIKSYIKFGKR